MTCCVPLLQSVSACVRWPSGVLVLQGGECVLTPVLCCRIAMETAGLGMAGVGYQYVAPNHIVRAPIH